MKRPRTFPLFLRGITAFAFLAFALPASAAPIRVAVAGEDPFVRSQDGVWTGLAIAIWEQAAAKNDWSFVYTGFPTQEEALRAVRSGAQDVLVGDVTITSELHKEVDFSQPFFRTGQQIMVLDSRPHTIGRLLNDLATWGHLKIFWYLAAGIAVFTLGVTLFERKHNPDFPKTWRDGLAEAFYYVISLALTGKSVYKGFPGLLGRLVLVFWMLLGVITVAYLTSSITSVMTMEKLESHIAGPQDLPGKRVGAVADTPAVTYLRNHDISFQLYPDMPGAVGALVRGQIDALVGDAPILQSYDFNHPKIPITEVGPIFSPLTYGFAMPIGSPVRVPLNRALLQLFESGALLELGQQYFGPIYHP